MDTRPNKNARPESLVVQNTNPKWYAYPVALTFGLEASVEYPVRDTQQDVFIFFRCFPSFFIRHDSYSIFVLYIHVPKRTRKPVNA